MLILARSPELAPGVNPARARKELIVDRFAMSPNNPRLRYVL